MLFSLYFLIQFDNESINRCSVGRIGGLDQIIMRLLMLPRRMLMHSANSLVYVWRAFELKEGSVMNYDADVVKILIKMEKITCWYQIWIWVSTVTKWGTNQ